MTLKTYKRPRLLDKHEGTAAEQPKTPAKRSKKLAKNANKS